MATGKSLSSRSTVLGHVDYLTIRNVYTLNDKKNMTGSTVAIYHGKKLIKDGFKNKDEAIKSAEKRLL